jgi:hypothetical protein
MDPIIACLLVIAGLVVVVLVVVRPDILHLRLRPEGLEVLARRSLGATPAGIDAAEMHAEGLAGEVLNVHQVGRSGGELAGKARARALPPDEPPPSACEVEQAPPRKPRARGVAARTPRRGRGR